MINIVKKELEFDDELKKKIEFICGFCNTTPTIINGNIRKIDRTNAIGIYSKGGKYSIGTFAHPDIAFEFASWLSPEFKLYLIKEFERLKKKEAYQEKIEWHANRILSKTNYVVHTMLLKIILFQH